MERNVVGGQAVYPYRNTEGEFPSPIRDWLESLPRRMGIGDLDAIRYGDDGRSKAIMALAQFDAESCGVHWDSIPWADELLGGGCQAWYVSGSVWRVDWLLHTGLLVLPS
jgi:hypothetical protein